MRRGGKESNSSESRSLQMSMIADHVMNEDAAGDDVRRCEMGIAMPTSSPL